MRWKDVVGYEGLYQVSDTGEVKRLKGFRCAKDRVLSFFFKNVKQPYRRVSLSKNDVSMKFSVHRLVAMAFIANPENKEEVNHKNGVMTDNRVENLEWATRQENAAHAGKTGLMPSGEKHFRSKFTDEQIREIRRMNYSGKKKAEELGTSYNTLWQIRTRRLYKHVED